MSYGRRHVFSALAVVTLLAVLAGAQSVISTHSGLINFFEGAVYLGDQPLESHLGRYPSMAEGAELRTEQGRAEVLLTPGAFLRLGEKGAIRLLSNKLSDTRVEMLAGSAIIEAADLGPDASVTLLYKDWKMHFVQKGVYRFDAEPARLWVQQGEAQVSAGAGADPVTVEHGMDLPLEAVLVPERSTAVPADTLADWTHGRSDSISADNAITAQIDEDPAASNSLFGLDGVTYFPLIGASSMALGGYGSGYVTPYELGFNSIYLPGYAYRPYILGLAPSGLRTYTYPGRIGVTPGRIGVSPGVGALPYGPRVPFSGPRPITPARPAMPAHPVAPVRVGGHH